MLKERVPATHHATDGVAWSKWIALITQQTRMGNPSRPGILEVIMDWPEGKDFGMSPEEEVMRAEEAWQIDYITFPQTHLGKCHVLTMAEATTGWLETYPVSHATPWNTILGTQRQHDFIQATIVYC
ncbi:hypothetical protein llap_12409 [Limosa lapponica baueri]|uniref:Uncharacterized protein n=1 Tax=Limosa lapponica baueri TaxID=1758121 RepID=A0A2I0TU76_LIMLA|nr:hypothetical protein llap_12409 [Limosa lapponica baueri]